MAEPALPRIICDRCLKDATVELPGIDEHESEWVLVRCHDEEQLIARHDLRLASVFVWSQLRFWTKSTLKDIESRSLTQLGQHVKRLGTVNRVRRSQGAAALKRPPSEIDPIIDLLVLFRADAEPTPPTPPLEPVVRRTGNRVRCPTCTGKTLASACSRCGDSGFVDEEVPEGPF
jgi:hypothetical protein